MKKKIVFVAVLALGMYSCGSKESKISIKKEVKMENINGKSKLTVETTENGKTTKATFVGDAAEKEMKKIESKECCEGGKKCEKKIVKKVIKDKA